MFKQQKSFKFLLSVLWNWKAESKNNPQTPPEQCKVFNSISNACLPKPNFANAQFGKQLAHAGTISNEQLIMSNKKHKSVTTKNTKGTKHHRDEILQVPCLFKGLKAFSFKVSKKRLFFHSCLHVFGSDEPKTRGAGMQTRESNHHLFLKAVNKKRALLLSAPC